MTTVLGSCVAACLWDPAAGVGGMNHFLLPEPSPGHAGEALRYGVHAMELLVNALFRAGAIRSRLQARLFGGAQLTEGAHDVGRRNAAFAVDFLHRERIPYLGGSLGGTQARRLEFWPVSGRARQRLLVENVSIFDLERRTGFQAPPSAGAVQLF